MRILRQQDYRVMPWKNGGGSTTEVAIFPAGAALDQFDWRLSMARVEADGPFSAFPGIDRTLTLLDGPSLELDVDERAITLVPGRPSLAFAGEARVLARVPAGPITDFNVMTRRESCRHGFRSHDVASDGVLSRGGGITALFLAHGDAVTCQAEGVVAHLGPRDCLILDAGEPRSWRLFAPAPATLFQIEIG